MVPDPDLEANSEPPPEAHHDPPPEPTPDPDDADDADEPTDPFSDLDFDPKRLLNGDRVIVDFGQIDSYEINGERLARLSRLDLDPPLRGPRFKAVVRFENRNGGWECGGPLAAIRPASKRTARKTTDDRDS